jgi:hypothetical protein
MTKTLLALLALPPIRPRRARSRRPPRVSLPRRAICYSTSFLENFQTCFSDRLSLRLDSPYRSVRHAFSF